MAISKITDNSLDITDLTIADDLTVTDDLLLASDSAVIKFGADADVTITHDADDGLVLKSTATADDNPFLLTLQTGETDLAADDVIGKIAFQAPDEGTGTDAILVSAAIQAVAEGNHSSTSNATQLEFHTANSELAHRHMTLTSYGDLVLNAGTTTYDANFGGFGGSSAGMVIHGLQPAVSWHETDTDKDAQIGIAGSVWYFHTTDSIEMKFKTNDTERMSIAAATGQFRHTTNTNSLAGYIVNEHGSSPYGLYIQFDTAAPDNADNYFLRLIDSSATKGTWYSDGDIATADGGSVNSDSKLKDRITDATDKWDDVKKLKVRNFYWKESYLPKKKDKKMIGFIAQEVETVFPGLVWEQKDTEPVKVLYTEQDFKDGIIKNEHQIGDVKTVEEKDLGTVTKTLKESKFIPILTKALQEAMERIETLEAKVKALEDA